MNSDPDSGRGPRPDHDEDTPGQPEIRDSVLTELFEAGLSSRDTIGPYRVLRLLGEGGMGVVYEAQQSEPVRRRVALKVIKEGMQSKEVLARFDSERQALAVMDHPAIATVFDGGQTDTGRPYFAMELVHGIPIVQYCERKRMDTSARLRLFVELCHAVQHAHQKGVIHRDLKPSNTLVHEVDGEPRVKIIDFGIAKAIAQPLTELTVMTANFQVLGTPAYMSPEQLDPSGLDIDTRSDVYSLGVMLYELLTGSLPFGGTDKDSSLEDLRQRVLSEEPVRPSRRVSALADTREHEREHTEDSRSQVRRLRGDVDWITLKALEKDRSRRYASASELAADVERHLANEPVMAGPPGLRYRLEKFVARHRLGVGMAATVVTLLVVAVLAVSMALVRARRAEEEAQSRASEAEQVRTFLVDLFDAADPYRTGGEEPSLRDLLERGSERIRTGLHDQPGPRAQLLATLGRVNLGLGSAEEADALLAEAERVVIEQLPERGDLRGSILGLRTNSLTQLGKPKEALRAAEQSLELRLKYQGRLHVDTVYGYRGLAFTQQRLGRIDEAMANYVEALAIDRELGQPVPVESARLLGALAWLEKSRGLRQAAEDHYAEALELWQRNDPENPHAAWVLGGLADLANQTGNSDEALRLYGLAVELQTRTLGRDHVDTMSTLSDLAAVHYIRGEWEIADELWQEVLEGRTARLGSDHPDVASVLSNLGLLYRSQVILDKAEDHYRRALDTQERVYGRDSLQSANTLGNLALLLARQRRAQEGLPLAERGLEIERKALGETAPGTLYAMITKANLLVGTGRTEEAAVVFEQAFRLVQDKDPVPPDLLENTARGVGRTLLLSGGDPEEAWRCFETSKQAVDRSDGLSDGEQNTLALAALGQAQARGLQGRLEEAERLWLDHLEVLGDQHEERSQVAHTRYRHATVLTLLGRRAEALTELAEADRLGFADHPPQIDPALRGLHGAPAYERLVASYREPWAGAVTRRNPDSN